MSNLDQLEQKISSLDKSISSDSQFNQVFNEIESAARTASGRDIKRLRNILSDFRANIPNRKQLNLVRAKARDLAEDLMLANPAERTNAIERRNHALETLTNELDRQISKANEDVNLLRQIQNSVNQSSGTVTEVKVLIDQLTRTDNNDKHRLRSLTDTLGAFTSILSGDSTKQSKP